MRRPLVALRRHFARLWRPALLAAAFMVGMLAGRTVPAVGTDDAAAAHVRQTHPEFKPWPVDTKPVDEQAIEFGLLIQGAAGAALFWGGQWLTQRMRSGRSR